MLFAKLIEITQTEGWAMAICSAIGAALSYLIGGFDPPAQALVALVIADYLTGMVAAWKTGSLESTKAFIGLARKAAIGGIVTFAHMMDQGMGGNTLRTLAICGYCGMEGLSLIENLDRAGYGYLVPSFLRDKLARLRDEKGVGSRDKNQ